MISMKKRISSIIKSIIYVPLHPEGRLNRIQFWCCIILINAILVVGFPLLKAINHFRIVFQGLYLVLGVYINVVLNVKRCHDRNRTGPFFFLFFIPVLNLWYLFEVLFMPGTKEKNRFDPH